MAFLGRILVPFTLALTLIAVFAAEARAQERGRFKRIDVPYAETPREAVAIMLRLAEVGPDDIVYDLGSGDGRIVIAAVRDFGARFALGVDIDRKRVLDGMANAKKAGVSDRTRFVQGDVFNFDFSAATVLTTFMSVRINTELLPRMKELLRPDTRVVTFRFPIVGWKPHKVVQHDGDDIHLYVVPERWPAID